MLTTNQHNAVISNLNTFKDYLGGDIETINGINTLKFNNLNGKGCIRHLGFENGLASIIINASLTKHLTFYLNNLTVNTLNFIFCLKGSCSHTFKNSTTIKKLDVLQTALSKNNTYAKGMIIIEPNVKTTINIITINEAIYFKSNSNAEHLQKTKLLNLLDSLNSKKHPFYHGNYSLKIGEHVRALLNTNTDCALTELIRFKGISYFILANQIELIYNESIKTVNKSTLTSRELKRIASINNVIKVNPEEPYTIGMLCSITRLSPAKLQEGFKILNNRTVADYIRHIRLAKAENLIKTTDLNISEIVYSIGFTSRSYFCKIFKTEYGCSPKQYKKKVNYARVLNLKHIKKDHI